MTETVQHKLDEAEALRSRGDGQAALALYRDILKQSPQEPRALQMMGVLAQQAGNAELALKFIEAALAAKPDFAVAWYNRGLILHAQGRKKEALQSARASVEISPENGDAWCLIGQILKEEGNFVEARGCYERAIALQPDNSHFHDNYAFLLSDMGDWSAAYTAARKATLLDNSYPPVHLGNILCAMGHPEPAAKHFADARATHPGAVVNEALALLQMGEMARGWALWEQRPEFETPLRAVPLWRGQKVSRLVLHEEQGFGDLIQLLRYVPLFQTRAEHIEAYVRGPLRSLFAENFPYIELLGEDNPQSSAEARCRWSSAPYFFSKGFHDLPPVPYLISSSERRKVWRDRLRDVSVPRIGLVWAGGKNTPTDARRSLDIKIIEPLIATGSKRFVSLQKDRVEKLAGVFDAAPFLKDFSDTAALIDELDLVITVDTAVAHLAGALGKPVFILLPFQSDVRWLLGREDSPWYETARLFRQKKHGDWAEVIENVSTVVRKFLGGDASVLRPSVWQGECLRQNPDALPLPV